MLLKKHKDLSFFRPSVLIHWPPWFVLVSASFLASVLLEGVNHGLCTSVFPAGPGTFLVGTSHSGKAGDSPSACVRPKAPGRSLQRRRSWMAELRTGPEGQEQTQGLG